MTAGPAPDPAALFDGSLTPGVYGISDPPRDDLSHALAAAGWTPAVVSPAVSTRHFYAAVATGLGLPDWFGANLDALWDSLTDLDAPTALVLTDWRAFAAARPERWAAILEVLTERTRVAPPFAVVLA